MHSHVVFDETIKMTVSLLHDWVQVRLSRSCSKKQRVVRISLTHEVLDDVVFACLPRAPVLASEIVGVLLHGGEGKEIVPLDFRQTEL